MPFLGDDFAAVSSKLSSTFFSSMSLAMIREKWTSPTIPSETFDNRTVLITGANTGLGREVAERIASLKAERIIITARSQAKGDAAKQQIEQSLPTTIQTKPEIIPLVLEMDSAAGIAKFMDTLRVTTNKLDAAILNAGLISTAHKMSPNGFEETIQVNVASTVLLAAMLLPLLMSTAKATNRQTRMTVVSSRNSIQPTAFPDNPAILQSMTPLQTLSEARYFPAGKMGGADQYSRSKLLLEYALRRLALESSLYDERGSSLVVVNSVCPGATVTELGRNFDFAFASSMLRIWQGVFAKTVADGATIYLQALAQGQNSMGEMWVPEHLQPEWKALTSEGGRRLGDNVWNELKRYLLKHDQSLSELVST